MPTPTNGGRNKPTELPLMSFSGKSMEGETTT